MIDEYLVIHSNDGVILDTNIFLLFLIGNFDKSFIKDFKRTMKYDPEEFEWLNVYVSYFSTIYITPQILAETWNFVEKITEPKFSLFLESTLNIVDVIEEKYINKSRVVNNQSFSYVGVTDTSIIEAAIELNLLVITDDFRSFTYYSEHDVSVINLNQFKTRFIQ